MPNADAALSEDEAAALFAPVLSFDALLIAVSGGPDSIALVWLMQRWAKGRTDAPRLIVASVDHGLRADSAREAAAVATLCAQLGLPHETLLWTGEKPRTRVQETARLARERLLLACAMRHQAGAIVMAHHADDQAETVLMRLAAGSGLAGLKGMALREAIEGSAVVKLRPLLDIPKSRLVATCQAAGLPFVTDPSNANEAFARARLRRSAAVLAREGLTPSRLVTLARRMRQVDEALDQVTDEALQGPLVLDWPQAGTIQLASKHYDSLPQAVRLRVVQRAVAERLSEGHGALADVERLEQWLASGMKGRRTLGGVLVSRMATSVTFQPAPLRRPR